MKKISKKRRESLEFHIKVNDYFVSLATFLDLGRQGLGDSVLDKSLAECLARTVNDLMYLQENYRITKTER
jgi:hypothetical protein